MLFGLIQLRHCRFIHILTKFQGFIYLSTLVTQNQLTLIGNSLPISSTSCFLIDSWRLHQSCAFRCVCVFSQRSRGPLAWPVTHTLRLRYLETVHLVFFYLTARNRVPFTVHLAQPSSAHPYSLRPACPLTRLIACIDIMYTAGLAKQHVPLKTWLGNLPSTRNSPLLLSHRYSWTICILSRLALSFWSGKSHPVCT